MSDDTSVAGPGGFEKLFTYCRASTWNRYGWAKVALWAGLLLWLTANTALFLTLLTRADVQTDNVVVTPKAHGLVDRGARGPWALETAVPQPPSDRFKRQ